MSAEAPLLELRHVARSFGGIHAVRDVTLTLARGEVIGVIGPNGAGKTTLVNVITGVHPPSSGEIFHEGHPIHGMKPYQVAARGIARTFQVVQPFPDMTVLENAAAGALFGSGIRNMNEARDAAMEHLRFTGLDKFAGKPAAQLTLAQRKRLELAKSLAMSPRLLMLDEVNAGLNTAEVEQALELIRAIAARGITVLIIEHLLKVVLTLCNRVVVLHHGELIADDAPGDVVKDPRVIKAYLGDKFAQRYGAING